MNFEVFTRFSYGMYIVSVYDSENKRFTGCLANSIMQVTAQPPIAMAVSLNHNNHTLKCIEREGAFSISILPETADPLMIGRFGFRCGADFAKYEEVAHTVIGGVAVPDAACGYLICKLDGKMQTETHDVLLGRVSEGEAREGKPMTYAYYHEVIKGKTAKNAPTYIPPQK